MLGGLSLISGQFAYPIPLFNKEFSESTRRMHRQGAMVFGRKMERRPGLFVMLALSRSGCLVIILDRHFLVPGWRITSKFIMKRDRRVVGMEITGCRGTDE